MPNSIRMAYLIPEKDIPCQWVIQRENERATKNWGDSASRSI
jgi:hypothetical protein